MIAIVYLIWCSLYCRIKTRNFSYI